MSASYRISGKGRLTQAKTARFTFDDQAYTGVAGDTLASALLANGVHLVGRSFKYHRPRGILSAGAEEPNALVGIHRDAARKTPNVRATVQELYDGLTAVSQNRWPSLSFDVGAVNDMASPFFSAGFYYKTFMWPKAAWKSLYEPKIREAAGLGVSPDLPDPDHYAARFAHFELLVLCRGAAGIPAALAAADTAVIPAANPSRPSVRLIALTLTSTISTVSSTEVVGSRTSTPSIGSHSRVLGVELARHMVEVVPALGDGERDDAGRRVGHLLDDALRIVRCVQVLHDGSDDPRLPASVRGFLNHGVETALSLHRLFHFEVEWHHADAADAPVQCLALLHELIDVHGLVGPMEPADTEVHDPDLDL